MAHRWLEKTKSFLTAGPPPKFVALDMEGRRLRIVFAEPHRGLPRFRTLAVADAPEELDVKDAKAVGRFIAAALKQHGLPTTRVLMDVPRSQAVLKTLTLPPVESERELPAMVRYQVEKELPFPLDQAVIDFTVDSHYAPQTVANGESVATAVENKPTTMDVLVAAVQRSVVEHHQQVAEAGGFRLHRLGLRPYADVRCLDACLSTDDLKLNNLLVHVLPGEVEINLLIEGGLAFSRSGAIRQHDDDGRVFTAREILDGFVVEIARSAQSALSAHRGRKIDRVFITGDTGQEQAILEIVAERFRTPCAILDPAAAMKIESTIDGRGFITPLGLAIAHGAADTTGRMPFDFLNPKNPPVERNLKRIRNVAAAASLAVLLLGALAWGLINRADAAAKLAALRSQKTQLEEKNKPIEKLRQRAGAVDEWKAESHNWLDHWANISAAFPPATEAYITTLKTNPDGSFAFNVKARTSRVITDLSKSLREAGYDVKLGAETVQNDDFGFRYSTSFRLAMESKEKVDLSKLRVDPRPADDGSIEILRSKARYIAPATNGSGGEESPASTEPEGTEAAATPEPVRGGESGSDSAKGVGTAGEKSSDNRERTDDKSKSSGSRSRDDRSRERR